MNKWRMNEVLSPSVPGSISEDFSPSFPSAPLGRFYKNTVSQIPPQKYHCDWSQRDPPCLQRQSHRLLTCEGAQASGGKWSWKFSLSFRNRATYFFAQKRGSFIPNPHKHVPDGQATRDQGRICSGAMPFLFTQRCTTDFCIPGSRHQRFVESFPGKTNKQSWLKTKGEQINSC